MPNTRGGSKYKKHKKGQGNKKPTPLILEKDSPGCMYAVITKKNGTSFEILCSNGKTERGIIRGKFRKRVWLNINDIVLVDTNDLGLFIIVHKYSQDDIRQLRSKGELEFVNINDIDDVNKYGNIYFDDNDSDDDNDDIDKELEQLKNNNINIEDI